jgi:hypothetical protein
MHIHENLRRFKSSWLLKLLLVAVFLLLLCRYCRYSVETTDNWHTGGANNLTRVRLGGIAEDLETFRKKCGSYPTTEMGLSALRRKPQNLRCPTYPADGFIDQWTWDARRHYQIDDWNEPITYVSDGKTYRIQASHGIYKVGP